MKKDLFNIVNFKKFESFMKKVVSKDEEKKEHNIETSTGRVYIHGNRLQLKDTEFVCGARYNIYPNKAKDSVILVASKEGKYKVSQRKVKDGYSPIIDIKGEDIKEMFKGFGISLTVYRDCIIVKRTEKKFESSKENIAISEKVVDFLAFKKKKSEILNIDADSQNHRVFLKKASGGDSFEAAQLSMFDSMFEFNEAISQGYSYPYSRKAKEVIIEKVESKRIKLASFFCGMGGLDYAFKVFKHNNEPVFEEIFALDKSFHKETKENVLKYGKENCSVLEDFHIQTFRKNNGDHIVDGDFLTYPIENIPQFDVGLFTIPCVELSSVSPSRNKFKMLPKFIDKFIDIIKERKDSCKMFVIENSINMIRAGREFLDKIKRELPWFNISENGVDAADFGAGQHRERAIIIGSLKDKVVLEKPKLVKVKTVGDCLSGLHDGIPNQKDYSIPKEDTVFRMSFVKQGGNWQDVPEEYRKKGKFANYMRRLSLNEVSIAIANIRKSLITHPLENRILSVRECLRLFGLPDNFEVVGTLAAKQQMVANSVPMELGTAIAQVVYNALSQQEKVSLEF